MHYFYTSITEVEHLRAEERVHSEALAYTNKIAAMVINILFIFIFFFVFLFVLI